MLINGHIVTYVAQRMPIKFKSGKLLKTGDLDQSLVKNNGPNKLCYN